MSQSNDFVYIHFDFLHQLRYIVGFYDLKDFVIE
uniref:Uncharacterized protein n=1 Tax=Pyropia perforata TaxID=182771 RepID=A0A059XI82_PYRPE|nr:hypothetical protein [Neoporphyra perforata]